MGPGAGAVWHPGPGAGMARRALCAGSQRSAQLSYTHIDRLWSRRQRHLEIKRELVRAELRVEEAQEVLDL